MEKTTTTVRTSEHKIKPFKHIRIGDPMYFENIEAGIDVQRYKKFVCDIKTTCCKVGAIKIEEHTNHYDFGDFNHINVDVFLAYNDEQLEVYKDGCWYGEETLRHKYELGCDTAKYEIEVDGRYDTVHTGADGFIQ